MIINLVSICFQVLRFVFSHNKQTMIISKLNLLRFIYFASVNEFKTEICRNHETLRRALSKISKNLKQQQLMFTSDLKFFKPLKWLNF